MRKPAPQDSATAQGDFLSALEMDAPLPVPPLPEFPKSERQADTTPYLQTIPPPPPKVEEVHTFAYADDGEIAPLPPEAKRKDVISVSEATYRIKVRLEDIPRMTVEGEVTNCKPPNTSGHLYFTLGDNKAKLNIVFFKFRRQRQADFVPFANGEKVRVTGCINVFEGTGSYNLNAERVERCDVMGDLRLRFEQIKQRLVAEGLTDPTRKRPIPLLPKRIGVVTAAKGAAIQDILNILRRRFYNLHIIVADCRVQGKEAPREIAAAIDRLNRHFGPDSAEPLDAMIVGRGGGSYEDLWCFNEEIVARAVAHSRIPVISAVGHEPDIAMTDFVADLRAPTPSAAAELISAHREELSKSLKRSSDTLLNAMRTAFISAREGVRHAETVPFLHDPERVLEHHLQCIDSHGLRLQSRAERTLMAQRQWLNHRILSLEHLRADALPKVAQRMALAETHMIAALQRAIDNAQAKTNAQAAQLDAFNPFAVLNRGYSLTTDAEGHTLTSSAHLSPGDTLITRFADGTATSIVQ